VTYPIPKPALKIAGMILSEAITDAVVASKTPHDRPAKFIRVSRSAGRRPLLITDAARILVEVWAATVDIVEQTTNEAIAALQNAQGTMVDGAFIRGFDNIEGPVDFPDPKVSDMERWQFQGDLLVSTS
jgi:hypothetical protein